MATETDARLQNLEAAERTVYEIGREAYVYAYPLVTMDITRRQMTNMDAGKVTGCGPMNMFTHIREYPPASLRIVVRPNFDTLYSSAWIDLTKEPVIISTADTNGRYYMLPMLDMWTDVFASPGKRTTGTQASHFALVPPRWQGTLPKGMTRIDAPTSHVWIIGRTQTAGPHDYDAVHKIQDGYTVTPLSQWGQRDKPVPTPKATIDPRVDMKTEPLKQVNNMPALDFFRYFAELLKVNPPHLTDQPIVARMERIGIKAGETFDLEKLGAAGKAALAKAAADGLKAMHAMVPNIAPVVNGWQMNTTVMGAYGNYYLKRAIVAMTGLGANVPDDAVYPLLMGDADGKPLDGANKYLLNFKKDELPPVDAFWSVTLYDPDGFPVPNKQNQYALSSWMPLKYGVDGSLELYIQNENPGEDKEANWLPSPTGAFNLTMRLYAPRTEVLTGRWKPPAVKPVEAQKQQAAGA